MIYIIIILYYNITFDSIIQLKILKFQKKNIFSYNVYLIING